jgi:general secretion pathway protein K
VALVVAIFASIILTALAVGLVAVMRVQLLSAAGELDRLRCLYLAEAGLSAARSLLVYNNEGYDSLTQSWSMYSPDTFSVPQQLGDGFFYVEIEDASGRLDINTASQDSLAGLFYGDREVLDPVLDWRDQDDEPRELGAEVDYYLGLTPPYRARNGRFQTPGELMLVKGMTPERFFGDGDYAGLRNYVTLLSGERDVSLEGRSRINLSQFSLDFKESLMPALAGVITSYEFDMIAGYMARQAAQRNQQGLSLGLLFDVPGLSTESVSRLLDRVTVTGGQSNLFREGTVNVNTAPPEVLASLPGCSAELGQAIIKQRESEPFTSRGELAAFILGQADGRPAARTMINLASTKSSVFLVRSMGVLADKRTFAAISALVDRQSGTANLVRFEVLDRPFHSPEEVNGMRSFVRVASVGGS